jgi:hypothetical protein
MSDKKYQINGRVIDIKSNYGIAGLRVQAWDKDLIFKDLVGRGENWVSVELWLGS